MPQNTEDIYNRQSDLDLTAENTKTDFLNQDNS